MSHTPHELAEIFADHAEALAALKTGDTHFAHLAERYHVLNRAIHRAETDAEPVSDAELEKRKRERLALLDEMRGMLLAEERRVAG